MTSSPLRADEPTDTSKPVAPAQPASDRDLRSAIAPMLDAIVRLAGAAGGAVSVVAPDRPDIEPVVAVGELAGRDSLASWCAFCAESLRRDSECVLGGICRRDDRLIGAAFGPLCKHLLAVPLRHRDCPVGTLTLWFPGPYTLAQELTPLLSAVGDLVGTALDNERLAREGLRVRLASERQMLANEVHDSLAQSITYMRMRMRLMRDAISQGDELRAHKYASDVDETLEHSQQRLRELITYFRAPMDPRGLLHALDAVVARFLDRTGIDLTFVNRVPDLHLPPEREIEVFRVVQEALANVARHAQATHAAVCVERVNGNYVVAVEDDGVGLAANRTENDAGHYGIAIMHERARRLGGAIALAPNVIRGTRLQLTFPAEPQGSEASHD